MLTQANSLHIPLKDKSVQCVVTSPPYWRQRKYTDVEPTMWSDGLYCLGQELTPDQYVWHMVDVFRDIRRVLRKDGTLWLNLGDSYAKPKSGIKGKNLVGIPWRVALALQEDGWYLRSDIIWHKPNQFPESVKDRPTKSHEYLFLLTKAPRYYYGQDVIREKYSESSGGWQSRQAKGLLIHDTSSLHARGPGMGGVGSGNHSGRNKRTVWTVPTKSYSGAHFATFPPDLVRPCILAGSPVNGIVLDPFAGSCTVGQVCRELGRRFVGLDLSMTYLTELGMERINEGVPAETQSENGVARGLPLW